MYVIVHNVTGVNGGWEAHYNDKPTLIQADFVFLKKVKFHPKHKERLINFMTNVCKMCVEFDGIDTCFTTSQKDEWVQHKIEILLLCYLVA